MFYLLVVRMCPPHVGSTPRRSSRQTKLNVYSCDVVYFVDGAIHGRVAKRRRTCSAHAYRFAGFPLLLIGESPSRAFEIAHASDQKSTRRRAYSKFASYATTFAVGSIVPGLICVCSQVSEVEMRGMLALEMELSVEEILVYRDVAR